MKLVEMEKAIALRKQGKTYSEILSVVPVSKSTLSLWLRDVGLSSQQKQKITKKNQAAQQRGAAMQKTKRMRVTEEIYAKASRDITSISSRELFLLGVMLYWAEGTKPSTRPGSMVEFANSDPGMVALFTKWLVECCEVDPSRIFFRLHLHESHRQREKAILDHWSAILNVPVDSFTKTVYKRHAPKTNRSKIGNDYIGLVSVRVRKSTNLNRRIMGWVYAIIATQK